MIDEGLDPDKKLGGIVDPILTNTTIQMSARPVLATFDVYNSFPDNESLKTVYIEASGRNFVPMEQPRHVFLWWRNYERGVEGDDAGLEWLAQVVQLANYGNGYKYIYPVVKPRSSETIRRNTIHELGILSRDAREHILAVAESIDHDPNETDTGCRLWMNKLLRQLARDRIIPAHVVQTMQQNIPLSSNY